MTTVPQDFAQALEAAGLSGFFAGCTGAHRREYLKWIAEAKRPETRSARIEKSLQMLAAKSVEESARGKSN